LPAQDGHLVSQGDHLKFQRGAAANPEREQGTQGGQKREHADEHADDGMTAAPETLHLLGVWSFEYAQPRPRLHLIRFHGVLAPNARLRAVIVPGPPQVTSEPAGEHAHGAPARMGWARLLKRVFDIDLEHCPRCGGEFRIIAAIEEPAVIVKILTHLGLPARAPPRSPARPLAPFQAA
jgi:hypothetical protein